MPTVEGRAGAAAQAEAMEGNELKGFTESAAATAKQQLVLLLKSGSEGLSQAQHFLLPSPRHACKWRSDGPAASGRGGNLEALITGHVGPQHQACQATGQITGSSEGVSCFTSAGTLKNPGCEQKRKTTRPLRKQPKLCVEDSLPGCASAICGGLLPAPADVLWALDTLRHAG